MIETVENLRSLARDQKLYIDIWMIPIFIGCRDTVKFDKKVLAFYYVWYGTPWGPGGRWRHWNSKHRNPDIIVNGLRDVNATNYPLDGVYDSLDDSTIKRHISRAKEAEIDGFILSWWGFSPIYQFNIFYTHEVLEKCLKLCPEDFGFTIYYETAMTFPLRDKDRKMALEKIHGDLKMLLKIASKSNRWIKVNGKPLIALFIVENYTAREWVEVKDKLREDGFDPFFLGETYNLDYLEAMDGLHTYTPVWITARGLNYRDVFCEASEKVHRKGGMFAATVVPGCDTRSTREDGIRGLVPREGGYYYRMTWEAARESKADWVLITSWNEWHEGTEIEPSLQYTWDYLSLTKQQICAYKEKPLF